MNRLRCHTFGFALAIVGTLASAQSIPNAVPMPTPEIQYLDASGAPLSGAYLCTYAAGTTTPLATYTDSSAGTPNANPIVLDSAGRASVWVGPALYKFVLRTAGTGNSCSTGIVAWTQDNVGDSTLFFLNYVKTVGTSNLLTYTNPASGAVQRTQFGKNNDVLSAKDFGCAGDGTTDDTTCIVAALAVTTLGTASSAGVCIYFPDGIYRTTAALSSDHTVCLTGDSWRLKYTGSGTITGILTLVGDPTNAYGAHASWLEGSFIQGAILDGQGHATNGLVLQGVVSSQLNYLRATNVTGAGFMCNWCQQTTFERAQVSADFEAFSTVPTNGVVIDNVSAANILNQVNIDHVSGDGLVLKYALNTLVHGGTSEGNGGWGVTCTSTVSPLRQCFNNLFEQFDTEVNTSGDYLFDDANGDVYDNMISESNSFSVPGIVFSGAAHSNVVIGGSMGCGSNATIHTANNYIRGIAVSCASGTPWVDLGQNDVGRIYNQANGLYVEPVNNNHLESIIDNAAGTLRIDFYTPAGGTYAEMTVGGSSTSNWIGFVQNNTLVPWLVYPAAGMQFQSLDDFRGMATSDMSIVNHHIGMGRFNDAPLASATVHIQDSVKTNLILQNASGQGADDLQEWMDYTSPQDTAGTIMSRIDYQGTFWGEVNVQKPGGGVDTYATLPACAGGVEGAIRSMSDAAVNTWGTAVTVGAGSFHVSVRCNGTAWTVWGK